MNIWLILRRKQSFHQPILTIKPEFAKEHFDFAEITIQPELLKTIDDIFDELKKAIGNFEVLGHIHWEVIEFKDITRNIEVLKGLGAKKITIHPFQNLSIEDNIKILSQVGAFLRERDLGLRIENVSNAPYNSAENILQLLEKIPNANLTLDIGHANRNKELEKFIGVFKTKIRHIHLHDNIENFDHLFYDNQNKLSEILAQIRSCGYDGTILLETFSVMSGGKNVSQEFPEIKKLHLEQLHKIKPFKAKP